MWPAMFLSKSLGIATLNPRRLLILSSIISVYVQGQSNESSACKDVGLNSTAVCEPDTLVIAADDGNSNSNTAEMDENNITVNELSARDDKKGGGKCAAVGLVFARGTTEPAPLGTLTGPPYIDALNKKMGGKVDVQGVDYPADVPGFLAGGSPQGSAEMARLITESRAKCPDMKLIVSGYSQGCQLVHNAMNMVPADVAKGVGAVVMFGDPMKGKPIKNMDAKKVITICHDGDKICDGTSIILAPHLTYSMDAGKAADFSANALGGGNNKRDDHTGDNLLADPGTPLPVEPANPIAVPMKVVKNWNLWQRS